MKMEDFRTHGISITELAKVMDYSPSYVNLVVNGLRKPGKRFLRDLEKVPVEKVIRLPKHLKNS